MNNYIKKNIDQLFPKKNSTFECYLINDELTNGHYDAIFHLEDPLIFRTGIFTVFLGLLISTCLIIYGLSYFDMHQYVLKSLINSSNTLKIRINLLYNFKY